MCDLSSARLVDDEVHDLGPVCMDLGVAFSWRVILNLGVRVVIL